MQKNVKIPIVMLAVFLLAFSAVNYVMAQASLGPTSSPNSLMSTAEMEVTTISNSDEAVSIEPALDVETLKKKIPTTFEEAETSISPLRARFLLWTHDGVHVLWGIYGNGRFVGTDNLGKRCWGIYGRGVFAGFSDGEFFWGRYANGAWKAQYLFDLRYAYGKYVLFPQPTVTSTIEP